MLTFIQRKRVQDHRLRIAAMSMPPAIWLGCLLGDPTGAGSFASEISNAGTGYARQNITGLLTETDASSGISILNALVTFAMATADWGDVAYVFTAEVSTWGGGTMMEYARLSEAIPIVSGQTLSLVPGQVIFRSQ